MQYVPEALALSDVFREFRIKPGGINRVEYADGVMRQLQKAGWGAQNVHTAYDQRSEAETELRVTELVAAFNRAGFKPSLLQDDRQLEQLTNSIIHLGFAPPPVPRPGQAQAQTLK